MIWGLFVLSAALPAFLVLFAYVAMRVCAHRLARQAGYGVRKD